MHYSQESRRNERRADHYYGRGQGHQADAAHRGSGQASSPLWGIYRLIDIPLSNCTNSQLYKILIFPQYKSQSLVDHLEEGWNIFSRELGQYLRVVAPQQRMGEEWYRGTADCVRQNLYLIKREMPRYVQILSGDHVYKMDYAAFRDYHEKVGADMSVGFLEVDQSQGSEFGIAEVDSNFRIRAWAENRSTRSQFRMTPRDAWHPWEFIFSGPVIES